MRSISNVVKSTVVTVLSSIIVSALVVVLMLPAAAHAQAKDISPDEARRIAVEAYVYTYPLVLMDITRRISVNVEAGARPGFGPMNLFTHMLAFPPGDFKEVIRPNFDTLYSIAWLDLTKGPVVVSAPDTQGRYYMLPMIDMWTDVFAVPGKRTSGTKAAHFAVTGPGWKGKLPSGMTQLPSPTPYVWIIGRTQTNGPKDYENVHKVQEGYKVTLLSDWGKQPRAVKVKIDPTIDMKTPPLLQANTMPAKRYFTYAAELMKLHTPHLTDGSILMRMKRIGLEPGKDLNFDKLTPEVQKAFADGAAQGLKLMQTVAASQRNAVNGWVNPTAGIGVYGNEYLQRAVIAMIGLGANPAEDAVYPTNLADADGKPVMGDQRYVMHFAKEQLPPADAFWSLTMYDADGFPVLNPLKRYAIGDRDELQYNQDGSLDIYIQAESPGKDKEANWLPSPKAGEIRMSMRLYMPGTQVLTGEWMPPVVKRVQ